MTIRMIPSINMCGFLYSGCDTGGFSHDANSEMIIRWTQFSIFTPLLRNHSVMGSRYQEPYSYDDKTTEIMRDTIELRYSLIPYLYSEYMKAALESKLLFSYLMFEYEGKREREIDNQILCGESIMLAPIYENNSRGRYVYLPEDMVLWKTKKYSENNLKLMKQGDHFVDVDIDEVPIFIRKNSLLPIGNPAETVDEIDNSKIKILGFVDTIATYTLYDDDGQTKAYESGDNSLIKIKVEKKNDELYISIKNKNNSEIKTIEFDIIDGEDNRYSSFIKCENIDLYKI